MVTVASEGYKFGAAQTPAGYAIPITGARSVGAQIFGGESSSTVTSGRPLSWLLKSRAPSRGRVPGFSRPLQAAPADNAGLSQGDNIAAVEGTAITSPEDLTDALLDVKPGAGVTIDYLDPLGQPMTTSVTPAGRPPQWSGPHVGRGEAQC